MRTQAVRCMGISKPWRAKFIPNNLGTSFLQFIKHFSHYVRLKQECYYKLADKFKKPAIAVAFSNRSINIIFKALSVLLMSFYATLSSTIFFYFFCLCYFVARATVMVKYN